MFKGISIFDWIQIIVIGGTFLLSAYKTLFPNRKNTQEIKKNTNMTENIEKLLIETKENSEKIRKIIEKGK